MRRVLTNLIEDDHRVVQRVPQDGQHADDGRGSDLEARGGVDADGDNDVVTQGEQGGHGHLPGAEVDPDEAAHEKEEDHQASDRLAGHIRGPGRADGGGRHVACVHAVGSCQGGGQGVEPRLVEFAGLNPYGGGAHGRHT